MSSRRLSISLRGWLAIIVLILALAVLVIASLPETRVQQVMPMPPIVLPSQTPVSLHLFWKGL